MYALVFIGLYFQIYLFVTYVEYAESVRRIKGKPPHMLTDSEMLGTTILVPCFNEEENAAQTVQSLLDMDYPKDKLMIFVIDDGSTDNTWKVLQEFKDHPQVRLFQKPNEGGKYRALNFGLEYVTTPIVGCLDSDSYVDAQALTEVMRVFATTDAVAVIPSMLLAKPDTVMRRMQKVEYESTIYMKKMFDELRALYVAPGPFSIFKKKEVFDALGPYKEAYHTEDCEIGLRIQAHGMQIAHALKAIVYTHGPSGFMGLLRQRLRWFYGGIRNLWDYRHLILNKKYGDLGLLVMPLSLLSFFALAVVFVATAVRLVSHSYERITVLLHTGFSTGSFFPIHSPLYIIDTKTLTLMTLLMALSMVFVVVISRRLIKMRRLFSFDIVYGLIMYGLVAPIWSVYTIGHLFLPRKRKWQK